MRHLERLRQLEPLLAVGRDLWHPQPFCVLQPEWCQRWPALAAELLALPDAEAERLNDDGQAARTLLARHWPEAAEIDPLLELPEAPRHPLSALNAHWAWEIPGRKRSQIEAFAAAIRSVGVPVLDWCGGKGHLARLLALQWQLPASTLEINPALCADGEALGWRAGVRHDFIHADALTADLAPGRHAIALHACGELHRTLLRRAADCAALDIAPCCYHHGVASQYQPLSMHATLELTRDDLRLAVTETVTASARQARTRDRDMAWKLGFDLLRRQLSGGGYRTFKPVPPAWMGLGFEAFCRLLAQREGLTIPPGIDFQQLETAGRQRQREVMRYSIVRHAFRRAIEIWLALDMALNLEERGLEATLTTFCPRHLTPRNLLLSARVCQRQS
ncbi:MAG: methyltransferase [Betaproteobacteria bacterium]